MRILLALCLLSAPVFCAPKSETGDLNGAKFRIDVPENWNGGLVMYCHGYSPMPGSYDEKVPPISQLFLSFGYAVAQSGYVSGGWAIEEAVDDTEALRRYFSRDYGSPKETFVTGHSMGGFLAVVTLLEMFPNDYDGRFGALRSVGPGRRAGSWAAVFSIFAWCSITTFPGRSPNPVKIPKDFMVGPARNAEIQKLLDSSPEKARGCKTLVGAPRQQGYRDDCGLFHLPVEGTRGTRGRQSL